MLLLLKLFVQPRDESKCYFYNSCSKTISKLKAVALKSYLLSNDTVLCLIHKNLKW